MSADDVILVTLRALDELTAPFQSAENSVGGLGQTLGNFGNIVTGINSAIELMGKAWDFAVDTIKPFIDAAAESEVVVTKLETVLNSTGGAIELTSEQLQQMATEMQNLSGFSDEAELSAMTMLMRFENLNDIFPAALQITNDLARALGMDLTTAAQTVGKALDDPEAGIGRLNTAFKLFNATEMENIKTMAAHGDVAGAQAIIMERLMEKVGGAAEAYGKTFSGSLDVAREKLDNVREIIGGAMLPILGSLLDKVVRFSETDPTIQSALGFFQKFSDLQNMPGDIPVLSALGAAMLDLEKVSPVFYDIGQALLSFQGLINTGSAPLEAFIQTLDELAAGSGPLQTFAQSIQGFISIGQSEGWGAAIANLFSDIGQSLDIPGKIQTLVDSLTNALGGADWTGVGNQLAVMLGGVLETVLSGLGDIVKNVDWGPFGSALATALWEIVQGAFVEVFDPYSDKWKWLDSFGNVLLALLFPPSIAFMAKDKMQEIGNNIIDGLWGGVNAALSAIGLGGFANWWYEHIIVSVKRILGIASPSTVFMEIGSNIVFGLISGVMSMSGAVVSLFESLLEAALAPFASLLDFLGIDLGQSGSTTGGRNQGGGTGGTGSGTGSSGTGGDVSGQVVNNYFYGPVYIGTNGDLDNANYDCPSPHPLLTASQGSLLVSPSIG